MSLRILLLVTMIACSCVPWYCLAQEARRGKEGKKENGGSGLGNYEKPPAANNIPDHAFDIVLGRPTDNSIEVRVLHNDDGRGIIEYRNATHSEWMRTASVNVVSGKPLAISLTSLERDAEYRYRWVFTGKDPGRSVTSDEYSFHTQRSTGSSFVFSVTADSHLDENSSGEVYTRTLRNALADRPDFHLELGDTFMTGKYVKPEYSYGQYLAQRYYLSNLCSSAPLFFVMGNHDGESAGRGPIDWATTTRKALFPNPEPNRFYTGNTAKEPELGFPEDYYAWQWGDAQFIVLDPYRYTIGKRRGQGGNNQGGKKGDKGNSGANGKNEEPAGADSNWYWTLGDQQYQWLRTELNKPAKYRFVFIHHLVGGAVQNQRGGVEVATLWEWGGKNTNGENEFEKFRPGWDKPIHQLLVDSGASIVFHGHDHFFCKQDLDGIVYQEVPQPSHSREGNTRTASEYGYLAGEMQPSSGFVRVRVEPDAARIDYVRTHLNQKERGAPNAEVTFSYTVKPNTSSRSGLSR